MATVVLVTGAASQLGARTIRLLCRDESIERVIGIDAVLPASDLGRAQFVRAELTDPIVAATLEQEEVDTVVHLAIDQSRERGEPGKSAADAEHGSAPTAVVGSLQMLTACEKAAAVRRIVVSSSTAVYGASAHDPAVFTEQMSARRAPTSGPVREVLDMETFVRGLARRNPRVEVAILRLAPLIGLDLPTPLNRYFALAALPVPAGYNGRLQVLHIDDAAGAVMAAVTGTGAGVINVAADGVVTLRQAVRLARRVSVPVPPLPAAAISLGARAAGLAGLEPSQWEWLRFGCGLDTTRMRESLGYQPHLSTRETFRAAFGGQAGWPAPAARVLSAMGWG